MPPPNSQSRAVLLRAVLISAAVVAALAAAGTAAGFARWHARKLPAALVAALHASGADSAASGAAIVTPFRGLTVDSLQATFPAGKAGHLRITVARTVVTWRAAPAMRRYGRARRAFRALTTAVSSAPAATLALADSAWFASMIREIRAEGVEVTLGRDTLRTVATSPAVLRLTPQRAPLRCLLALTLDTLRIADVPLSGLHAGGLMQEGALVVDTFEARVLSGALHGAARLDLLRMRLDTLRLTVEGARFAARLDDMSAGSVHLEEGISMALVLGSGPLHRDSLHGEGQLRAGRLTADDLPVLTMLARILRAPGLRRSAFDSLSAAAALRPGGLRVSRLAGYGSSLSFASSGWIGWDGSLRQQAHGRLGSSVLRGLDPVVRHSLLPDPGGGGRFACTVKGTLSQPVVSLDQRMVARAVEGMFEQYRDDLIK